MDVNAELVRQGAAWVYRKYSRDPLLLLLEQEARSARRGLWALPETERLPPWEWRAAARESRTHVDMPPPGDRPVGLHRAHCSACAISVMPRDSRRCSTPA